MMELALIARKAIEKYFENEKYMPNSEDRKKYYEKKACFITLTINNTLRGCIGSLIASKPLWQDVVDNAINAAFNDYRFPPLKKEELGQVKIEVSILSEPAQIKYKNHTELLNKIKKNYGIILERNGKSSTFLPQVWEQIKDKRKFLEELSLKAGLEQSAWKKAKIYYYTVKAEKE
ncbi:MAG: AmmeMemoRadiSam system protein A [Candidatus Nanoarchaeia archaeon]|nr:AmmeMemoRadiSam system protein A [Candidatus Nanoarchaeia archaeon]MDD5054236.1 AmmeMemoRadiSam system protein A [Candidatus Nanoarchaeia archaeon]MDD5499941.1 AmmeMemoRadiSam system protein A [Candidatus Nanoarchaeia archaeon]